MNDEDFARHAFAAAFRSGQTGEPPTLPDVELLARNGRRANRNRHGLYAAGTTVAAGVAVAGVVTGPALLGLGSPSTSDLGSGAGAPASRPPSSPAPSSSSSAPDPAKPSPGVPCTTSSSINWQSVVAAALPKGVTATPNHAANCVREPNGSRSYEALFKLSTGDVDLQVNVGTGPDIAQEGRRRAGNDRQLHRPANRRHSRWIRRRSPVSRPRRRRLPQPPPATTQPRQVGRTNPHRRFADAAAIASLEAQKRAMASAQATASPAPGATQGDGTKPGYAGTCSQVGPDENACVSHLSKDSLSVVDVQLLRTGSSPIVVDVAASNGKDTLDASGGAAAQRRNHAGNRASGGSPLLARPGPHATGLRQPRRS